MLYAYPFVIRVDEQGHHIAKAADLKGLIAMGSSLTEVLMEAKEVAAMWLWDAENNKEVIPIATAADKVRHEPGEIVTLVLADTDAYRLNNETKSVRRNVSLPEGLAVAAEKSGLSLSKVLQEALRVRLLQ